ncbi:disease resistance protein RPV1-like [Cryptomeria japonica]|uniref:disease resistance protein RPV1-like n=1 Tax=Cryptomeria japonica TaxID=3369 RepID=UPI0027DA43D2|nr:disease resistance protein RPV1-like [Cryptomeria japonica]
MRNDLILKGLIQLRRQVTMFLPSQPKPPDFKPVGIDKQVQDVKMLLDMEGIEPAVAVIVCGFGGVGKTTLASQIIYELNLPSTVFKYCKVIIDETQEKTSHIIKLQAQIINDLGDEKVKLRDQEEGKTKIKEILGKQCCFLFIDNVVEGDYIEQLLPKNMADEKEHSQKLRMVITSRAGNLRARLRIKKCKEYSLDRLSDEAAIEILQQLILEDGEEPSKDFDEEGLMNDVAVACKGTPLLLSVYENHIRVGREKQKYEDARDALMKGDLNSLVEQQLEQKLLFVYHKLKDFDEDAQEAFLDICSYFHDWAWQAVSDIVGKTKLETLSNRMLINRRESNTVIVHDILLLMGRKEAKNTRFLNSEDSFRALKDPSKVQSVKVISLFDNTPLIRLKSSELNAVHSSLRVLMVGNWVQFDGTPCDKEFENLRYLHVGDIDAFPFQDASNLKSLRFFSSQLKPGIYLSQLPRTLKCIAHDPRQLEGLDAVSRLPEGLKFPASLRFLRLSNIELEQETLSHLDALEYLVLDNCDLKKLPEGLNLPESLSRLTLNNCKQLPKTLGRLNRLQSLY